MLRKVTDTILYVGANDHDVDLFEGQYVVPNGMSYNSYVILDEKIAVMDTIDQKKTAEWLKNIEEALAGRQPDYLVVQHMEPDHAASVEAFVNQYPAVTVVGNAKTFPMIAAFFPNLHMEKTLTVQNLSTLELGSHTLHFVFAPMVHWPEVMVSYESSEKILFSADGFGRFGVVADGDSFANWADDARRYFLNIVGKYGPQVQALLKKAAGLDIQMICPLHGPVLTENLGYYVNLYDLWSSYTPEEPGIVLCYTSVYGHTAVAVKQLAEALKKRGVPQVVVYDLARCDMAAAVADAFRYEKLVLATTTYNADIFPFMKQFIDHLTERGFQNRTIGLMENGSWGPSAVRTMKGVLAQMKELTIIEPAVTLRGAMKPGDVSALEALAKALMA